MIPFSDLARAAYCPRQLYYARREDDRDPPPEVAARRSLAFRYPELLESDDETLADARIAVDPDTYRENLRRLRKRGDWSALARPDRTRVFLEGKDCHGIVHKLLEPEGSGAGTVDDGENPGPPPVPSIVSPGTPPESGVWRPQTVRAVAAAKALAWERERELPRAIVEYPTHGVVRDVRLTARNAAAYRRTLRTVRAIDGPPSRVDDDAKCDPCEYREQCGTRTRSLRSLLGV